jgi:hypothetical protein
MLDAKNVAREQPQIDSASTKDYRARTPGILTSIQNDIAMKLGLGYLEEVKTMEGEVELEDEICSTIVVYELCARLLLNEDASISNYFSSLASERLNSRLMDKYKTKAKQEKRTDKYSSTLRVGD